MRTYLAYLNEIANKVTAEHSKYEKSVNWINPYAAYSFEDEKNQKIETIGSSLNWEFKNTKPWINSISEGCRLCGKGEWSCLFITGVCNANCFYCPARQDEDDLPQTQRLRFETPEEYAEYINRFGFTGVSFSGGEPLLALERTLAFAKAVRANCDPSIYMWMYTNGILGTEEKFAQLATAGIDEIRFDLGATNYNPKVLRYAAKFFQHVTVEIPAVPDELDMLKNVLPLLCEFGVSNLNLHQLRLTTYNAPKLLTHDYTYLHGEQPTVLESELAAFEIMNFVLENKLPIGVNYCNFQFKNRFQKAGYRNKMAQQLKKDGEEVTENGFLRTITIEKDGNPQIIALNDLLSLIVKPSQITLNYRGRVLENLDEVVEPVYVIKNQKFHIQDGLSVHPIILHGEEIDQFLAMMQNKGTVIPEHPLLFKTWQQEFIENGMREYF